MHIEPRAANIELAEIGADLDACVVLVTGLRTNLRALLFATTEYVAAVSGTITRYSALGIAVAHFTTHLSRGNNRGAASMGVDEAADRAGPNPTARLVRICAGRSTDKRRAIRQKRRVDGIGDRYERACRWYSVSLDTVRGLGAGVECEIRQVGALRPGSRGEQQCQRRSNPRQVSYTRQHEGDTHTTNYAATRADHSWGSSAPEHVPKASRPF